MTCICYSLKEVTPGDDQVGDKGCSFNMGHIESEVSLRHSGGDIKQRHGHMCLELGILDNLRS